MFDLADLAEECRSAVSEDVAGLSDDELLAAAVGWEAVRSGVEAAEARVLAELRVRGVTDRRFGLRTGPWVAAEARSDRREVNRRIRLGLHLRRLSLVSDAVAAGAISADHAKVLAEAAANPRVGDQIEAGVSVWVELARDSSFAEWAGQVRFTVARLDQDGGYDPNRDLARNRLRLTPFPDGSVNVAGELVGEQALVVRQCVEAHADRLFLRLVRDHDRCPELPLPTRATVLAMALAELVLRGSTVDLEHSSGPATDVTLVIEAAKPGAGPVERPEVDNHIDPFDPYQPVDRGARAGLVDFCGPATTPDGCHVHPDTAA
ncbi:MAG: hypothetical protein ACXWB2_19930, partial [Acidimicrobiales bacterium]